jgi:hypothetical protein
MFVIQQFQFRPWWLSWLNWFMKPSSMLYCGDDRWCSERYLEALHLEPVLFTAPDDALQTIVWIIEQLDSDAPVWLQVTEASKFNLPR